MRIRFSIVILLLCHTATNQLVAQDIFELPPGQKSDKIEIKVVNNLIVVPVIVNGAKLNFLLDSGAAATIIFKVDNFQSVLLNETSATTIAGAGSGDPVTALYSTKNSITVGDAVSNDESLYAILDERVDFSPQLGFPVQGVIGYELFKDFVVEVNYKKKYIKLYDPEYYSFDRCANCADEPLSFISKRPVINTELTIEKEKITAPLLLDSGSSDGIWLFQDARNRIKQPAVYFKDYLGFGLNGSITGTRARSKRLEIGKYKLNNVIAAFPNSLSTKNLQITADRLGTIGGEILRRFTTTYHYQKQRVRFKPNNDYDDPFNYNKSGLIIKHGEYTIEKEILSSNDRNISRVNEKTQEIVNIFKTFQNYRRVLEPTYVVDEVLENTPATRAGIQRGDQILLINGRKTNKLRLDQITRLFFQEEGKSIRLELRRGAQIIKTSFVLKELLP